MKRTVLQLVRAGERALSTIPAAGALPRGRAEVMRSFVASDPAMAEQAAAAGLDASAVVAMIGGASWKGVRLKPIEAALLAPAFPPADQERIAAALEAAQRAFWESQHFYLDEMAAAQASDIPNALMRETLLAVEERVVAYLRPKLREASGEPLVWVDYAAGPASFVNGALQRLRKEGLDISRLHVVLVEPAERFRAFAQEQPVLRELWQQGRLRFVDGILEDGETYEQVERALHEMGASKADVVTQAFGASYVADHLRPAMWRRMLGTAKPGGLSLVVATTTKYNPSRMIGDRLRDEVKTHLQAATRGRPSLAAVPALLRGVRAWARAFARPVPVDGAGKKQPALLALIRYGQGIKAYCPIRKSGEGFAREIEQATGLSVRGVSPVLDEQAVLIEV